MTPLLISVLCLAMVGTSFLSGIFGMAGGMILVGILLVLLPVPEAMMLHGVTQMASNGWRGLLWWKHVRWRAVGAYVTGCSFALVAWSFTRYVPSLPVALLLLGVTPFMVRLLPKSYSPNPESLKQGTFYGTICMTLILLTGVSGPLVDSFFLGGKLDRREIVATKAMCQIFGHAAKLIYFGALIDQAGSLDPARRGAGDRQFDDRHDAGQAGARSDERPAVSQMGERHHRRDRRILRDPRHGADGDGARFRAVDARSPQRLRSVSTR